MNDSKGQSNYLTEFTNEITLNGIIKDIDSQKVISNSKIILSDENNNTTTETKQKNNTKKQ